MNEEAIQTLDQTFNWHPCSQMKDYEIFKPLVIKQAYGSYIELTDGHKIIDAISSWWCKSLGHRHPLLVKALLKQLEMFEHVIFANTTNEVIVQLSKRLIELMPNAAKVFYTGDGSCAVEVALKMSVHSRLIEGNPEQHKFVAFKNGYHGETLGALSVSDIGQYKNPYQSLLFEPIFIEPTYVSGMNDPKWFDASSEWSCIEQKLEAQKDCITAIIFEPVLQAAGGMKIYSPDFLYRMHLWAKRHNIHLIADEIMTGIGRTGKMLASEYAKIECDFVCLSKGLTSGWMPFSCILISDKIYQMFYDDYEMGKAFLHSHTYSGNVMGACLALSTLDIIQKENLCERSNVLGIIMHDYMSEIAEKTKCLKNVRSLGAVVAADLSIKTSNNRIAFTLFQEAIKFGALLRPLGNTLYWSPPLTVLNHTLIELRDITMKAIFSIIK